MKTLEELRAIKAKMQNKVSKIVHDHIVNNKVVEEYTIGQADK